MRLSEESSQHPFHQAVQLVTDESHSFPSPNTLHQTVEIGSRYLHAADLVRVEFGVQKQSRCYCLADSVIIEKTVMAVSTTHSHLRV